MPNVAAQIAAVVNHWIRGCAIASGDPNARMRVRDN